MNGLAAALRGSGAAGRRSLSRATRPVSFAQGALAARREVSSSASAVAAGGPLEDERVLEHLVCPISKFPLRYDREHARLVCDEISVAYPIRNGVPVLVPAEGRILSSEQPDE